MWIPIDTRLQDHPKLRRISSIAGIRPFEAVGAVTVLWGLAADLETERLDMTAQEIAEQYQLPALLLGAMSEVGWAELHTDHVVLKTRNSERDAAREARREIARQGGLARAAQQAAASSSKQAASRQQAGSFPATDRQTDRQRKRQTGAAASPPALEGAGLSAAAAMKEALSSIGAAPPARAGDPVARLQALKEAS
jgi:hypothetical protein